MKNSKLILLFSELTVSEMKHFEDFVQSPIFNKSEQVLDLFKILKNFAADFHISLLTKKVVSEQLFPHKKSIEEKGLSVAMTKLTKLLEQFLAFQKYQKNESVQENYLLEALLERNQNKFVGQHLQKIAAKRSKTTEKSIDFFAEELVFLQQKHRYNFRLPNKKQVFQAASNSP